MRTPDLTDDRTGTGTGIGTDTDTDTDTDTGAARGDEALAALPGLASAQWTFTTRNVPPSIVGGGSRDFAAARPGDLILVHTLEIGQHRKVQLASGRYAENIVGEHFVFAVGDRYAPDQFEGTAKIVPGDCSVIAGGGIAGRVTAAHASMVEPTTLEPVALLTDADGAVINIEDHALPPCPTASEVTVIGVFGTSMNSGKTTAAASLALGLRRAGVAVAGVKATGTGAFGDYNAFRDVGVPVRDFVDVGMPSTYRMPLERIEAGFDTLIDTAAAEGAEVVVVEFADGVLQSEARELLQRTRIRSRLDGVLFAAFDSAGAVGGIGVLREVGLEPFAVSGLVSATPLGSRETRAALGVPLVARDELRDPIMALELMSGIRLDRRASRQPAPDAAPVGTRRRDLADA